MPKFLLFLFLSIVSLPALAERSFPDEAVRASLKAPVPYPLVQLGGKVYRMAPGAIVRDESNRKILHTDLPSNAEVLFLPDANGEIARIWILTPEERAALARAGRK
jgi:hypothetical protein